MTGRSRISGDEQRSRRRKSQRRGHIAEFAAAAYLIAKGHRILARRMKTPSGEIDLIAVKSHRLRFVEVKQRPTIADCEAAITPRLRQRARQAANLWLARQPKYQGFDVSFDLIFITSRPWPVYLPDAL